MTIEWLRDLVLIIAGLTVTAAVVVGLFMSYSLYRRARPIMESLRKGTARLEAMSAYFSDEVLRPLLGAAVIIQAMLKGFGTIKQFFANRKEKEKEDV